MFPTQTDLEFFEAKRTPPWAARIKRPAQPASWQGASLIDRVVNAHAGVRVTSADCETHNMCAFVSGWIRRGEPLIDRLMELTRIPSGIPNGTNPKKRVALAIKWSRRLATG